MSKPILFPTLPATKAGSAAPRIRPTPSRVGEVLFLIGGATAIAALAAVAIGGVGHFATVLAIFLTLMLLYSTPLWVPVAHHLSRPLPPPVVEVERRRLTGDLYGLLGSFDHGTCVDQLPAGTTVLLESCAEGSVLRALGRTYPLDGELAARVRDRSVLEPAAAASESAGQIIPFPEAGLADRRRAA